MTNRKTKILAAATDVFFLLTPSSSTKPGSLRELKWEC